MICNYCKKEVDSLILNKVIVQTRILFFDLKTKELFFCLSCSHKLMDLINVQVPSLSEQLAALK